MVERTVTITNKVGIHARPAALIVRTASRYSSNITLEKDGMEVDGKSIMGVMMLAAEPRSKLTIKAEGRDEREALEELVLLFENKFEEE